jgi:hypothetical protein
MPESIFAKHDPAYRKGGYPWTYSLTLFVRDIRGGVPSDPDVAGNWIRAQGYRDMKDELIASEVATIMQERGLPEAEAIEEVARRRMLNGFKRDQRGLFIEGRQLKALIKEAASIAADVGKLPVRGFGLNKKKGGKSFFSEHVFVREEILHLGVNEPTGIDQGFISTFRGTGIQYTEFVTGCEIYATIECDHEFSEEEWATIWQTAERQGLGAQRSQGHGTFVVTQWERQRPVRSVKGKRAA